MALRRARILQLSRPAGDGPAVGHIHRDGSITFRDRTYRTIKELPAECVAVRPDLDTYKQWKALYRAIDPRRRRRAPPTGGRPPGPAPGP